jgi:hypothetical protein
MNTSSVSLEEHFWSPGVSANQWSGQPCWISNRSKKRQHFLRNISGKSGDFTCSSSKEEAENVSANQRPRQPSWISNRFKEIKLFFRIPTGTFVVNLVTWHTMLLKKLKMWKVYNTEEKQMDAGYISIRKVQLRLRLITEHFFIV